MTRSLSTRATVGAPVIEISDLAQTNTIALLRAPSLSKSCCLRLVARAAPPRGPVSRSQPRRRDTRAGSDRHHGPANSSWPAWNAWPECHFSKDDFASRWRDALLRMADLVVHAHRPPTGVLLQDALFGTARGPGELTKNVLLSCRGRNLLLGPYKLLGSLSKTSVN